VTKLTSRDFKVLWSCVDCQVLSTSQVWRWHFAGITLRKAQKRLLKLTQAGYLNAIETKVCSENLVVLGRQGGEELRKKGWKDEPRKELPKDLEHHMGVVDIRIAFEKGLETLTGMKLRYFYAYWELGQFHWSYPIIPDALFSIRNAYLANAAVEFDRNTYSPAVFSKKLLQYRRLIVSHPISTVMVVAEDANNLERLGQELETVRTQIPLLVTTLEDLKERGLAAIANAQVPLSGTRTIAEQLEIDGMRTQIAQGEIKSPL